MSRTLKDLLLRARQFDTHIAVRAGEAERSYADLLDRSARLAHHFRDSGLNPGDRIAIMVEDGIRALEPHIAAALAGLVIVPVNARYRREELDHMLEDSGANALAYTDGVLDIVRQSKIGTELPLVIEIGGGPAEDTSAEYEQIVASGPVSVPGTAISPDDLVMIGYTSGTTGKPKGAMMTHRGAMAAVQSNLVAFRVVPYGALAFSGSVSFTALHWAFIHPHLSVGASIDFLQPDLTVDRWFDRMEQHGSTFTFVPTPLMDEFTRQAAQRSKALKRLTGVCHSGSPATARQRAAMVEVLGSKYVESYGMTESLAAVSATTSIDADGSTGAKSYLQTIGRPIAPADVYPVDESAERLPPGVTGELVIEGPSIFTGYWNDPEATAKALKDGRYHTGDLGHVDEQGFLYIDGRLAELIISGGANVYPAEIEGVLATHPLIKEASIVGIPHPHWGEAVAAVVVPNEGASLTVAEVVSYVQERLASYKKPTQVAFVSELPRNPNLKVLKAELPNLFALSASKSNGENG